MLATSALLCLHTLYIRFEDSWLNRMISSRMVECEHDKKKRRKEKKEGAQRKVYLTIHYLSREKSSKTNVCHKSDSLVFSSFFVPILCCLFYASTKIQNLIHFMLSIRS